MATHCDTAAGATPSARAVAAMLPKCKIIFLIIVVVCLRCALTGGVRLAYYRAATQHQKQNRRNKMLEEKLVDLQIQISALTIAIKNLTLAVTRPIPLVPMPEREQQADPEPEPTLVLKSAKMISIDIADAKPVDDDDDTSKKVSIDVLRDICMRLVREKPGIKPKVMKLIFSFNRAEKVQDVPVENRLELLKALEQL